MLIADKASGTQLIQELIAEGCHGVTRYEPTCDKIMRMNAQTAMIENGFVHIPETAPWLDEYLHRNCKPNNAKTRDHSNLPQNGPLIPQARSASPHAGPFPDRVGLRSPSDELLTPATFGKFGLVRYALALFAVRNCFQV